VFACAYVCGVSRSIVRATWFGCVLHSHLGTGCTKKIEPFSPKRTRGREMLHKYGSKPVQRLRFLTPTVRCVLRRKVLSAHAFRCFTMWQLDAGSSHAAQYIFLAVVQKGRVDGRRGGWLEFVDIQPRVCGYTTKRRRTVGSTVCYYSPHNDCYTLW
jgi:hypothetical protein